MFGRWILVLWLCLEFGLWCVRLPRFARNDETKYIEFVEFIEFVGSIGMVVGL
jgi:hypothetical protein